MTAPQHPSPHHDLTVAPETSREDFLRRIDSAGGWPAGYDVVCYGEYLGNGVRKCFFENTSSKINWRAVICTSDEYYWWKLSDSKKAEVVREAKTQLIQKINGL